MSMMRPPGAVACHGQNIVLIYRVITHNTTTHIDRSLQTRLNTSALKRRRNLAQGRALANSRLDRLGHLLRKLELRLDGIGPLHGHNDRHIGKPVVDGELDALLLDVGNDHPGVAERSAEGRAQQAHGAGAKHEDGGVICQACPVRGVEGDG
jgi:hypothetical protein